MRPDPLGEPAATAGATSGNAAVTGFAYNTTSGASTSTKETSPTGGVSTFALDSTGRVTSATDPLGRKRSQTWTPNSDLVRAPAAKLSDSSRVEWVPGS